MTEESVKALTTEDTQGTSTLMFVYDGTEVIEVVPPETLDENTVYNYMCACSDCALEYQPAFMEKAKLIIKDVFERFCSQCEYVPYEPDTNYGGTFDHKPTFEADFCFLVYGSKTYEKVAEYLTDLQKQAVQKEADEFVRRNIEEQMGY
jgi:hypothetical protein